MRRWRKALGVLFLMVGLLCDSVIGVSAGHLGRVVGATGRASQALTVVAGLTLATLAGILLLESLAS